MKIQHQEMTTTTTAKMWSTRMDQPQTFLLFITGLAIFPSCLSVQYTFMAQPKSRTEAQSCCKQNYTDLYTAKDEAEMKMMRNIIAAALTKQGIAASSQLYAFSYWVWSLDGSELGEESFWANGTDGTTNDLNQKLCVNMMDSKWYIDDCTTTHSFVCYDESNHTNRYFYISNSQKSWAASQEYCKQKYTDLASVRNFTDMENVMNILPTGNHVWIGLHELPCVWGCYNNSGSCINVTLDNMNRGPVTENHIDLSYSNVKLPFICYDDELVLVQQNKTWSEALWSCRDQGWELVSVLNQNIQNWVQQRADNASSPFVWLGLRYSCTLNFWFWVSGNVSCYQKWVEGQDHNTGNEQCGITGAIKTEGGPWFSLPETDRYNFICSKSHGY